MRGSHQDVRVPQECLSLEGAVWERENHECQIKVVALYAIKQLPVVR